MKLKESVQFKLKRFAVKYNQYMLARNIKTLDQNQRLIYEIAKNLIKLPESETLIAPLSGELFTINDDREIFMFIEHNDITIVEGNDKRGRHPFSAHLPEKLARELRDLFNKKAQKQRLELKKTIFRNIKNSLEIINEKVKWEQKTYMRS